MKECSGCKQLKSLDEFHRRGNGTQRWCKHCANAARVDYYKRNKERERKRNQAWYKKELEWLASLKDAPCTDCENKFHFSVMQWDHLPGTPKNGTISDLIKHGRKAVLNEIKNCELVCANCHAYRTWSRRTLSSEGRALA